jgi:hypothetical protein
LPGNFGCEPKFKEAQAVPNRSAPCNYFPVHLSDCKNISSIVRDFCALTDRSANTNDSVVSVRRGAPTPALNLLYCEEYDVAVRPSYNKLLAEGAMISTRMRGKKLLCGS